MASDIPVIVVGFSRPKALGRLLDSLSNASYPLPVRLIISIDGGGDGEVKKLATDFSWPFGEKELIFHEENMGLRNHVLSCGDMVKDHDAIIVLEDDLVVSPAFYRYALQAFDFYKDEPKIGGISLYHHAYNETAQFPFVPLADGSDVYFLQYASSWGQLWGKKQWAGFRAWYDVPREESLVLPANIRLWPENSWKKYFIGYLIEKDLYFVYPRESFTTIFGDEGTNIRIRETFLQVPLFYGDRAFNFRSLNDSDCVYDTWCEILPGRLKRLWPEVKDEDFDVDLYGMKMADDLHSDKIISGRYCKTPEKSFGREMKPHEENIIHAVPGDYFHFGRKGDFTDLPYLARLLKCHEKRELAYWYPIRDYHFYKQRLLTTGNASRPFSQPGFLTRKAMVMFGFVFRYLRKR